MKSKSIGVFKGHTIFDFYDLLHALWKACMELEIEDDYEYIMNKIMAAPQECSCSNLIQSQQFFDTVRTSLRDMELVPDQIRAVFDKAGFSEELSGYVAMP